MKGNYDRAALLPVRVRDGLRAQLDEVARRHQAEIEAGRGEVDLPYALRAKMPRAAATLAWQYLFPASRPCSDPATGRPVLHHLHESAVQRAVHDVLALLEATGGAVETAGPRELRDRALLELLYSTGARISEAVGLDVDDVDVVTRSVRLDGKGGKQRLVPVGRPALAALDAWLVRGRPALLTRGTPAVFLNARGGRLSRQSAWQVLRRAAEGAGITTPVSPHTLRHSFATHLLDGGADVRVVQELLGHASVTTTQVYTLVTVEGLREVWAGAHPRAR